MVRWISPGVRISPVMPSGIAWISAYSSSKLRIFGAAVMGAGSPGSRPERSPDDSHLKA